LAILQAIHAKKSIGNIFINTREKKYWQYLQQYFSEKSIANTNTSDTKYQSAALLQYL
jgi:hypothetical protein